MNTTLSFNIEPSSKPLLSENEKDDVKHKEESKIQEIVTAEELVCVIDFACYYLYLLNHDNLKVDQLKGVREMENHIVKKHGLQMDAYNVDCITCLGCEITVMDVYHVLGTSEVDRRVIENVRCSRCRNIQAWPEIECDTELSTNTEM